MEYGMFWLGAFFCGIFILIWGGVLSGSLGSRDCPIEGFAAAKLENNKVNNRIAIMPAEIISFPTQFPL
jgi:hypothetical protein